MTKETKKTNKDSRLPRCPKCHKTPIYCMCGGYNPRTNTYETTLMGVSQWRNHGKMFGYWKFFETELRKDLAKKVEGLKKGYCRFPSAEALTFEDKIQVDSYNHALDQVLQLIGGLE